MNWAAKPIRRALARVIAMSSRSRGGWRTSVILGLVGLALNRMPVPFGDGLQLLLGTIPILAVIRLLNPAQLVTAFAIANVTTITLWQHPWAWSIWLVEALILGLRPAHSSPVRSDMLFWIMVGSPLVGIVYGGLLGVDTVTVLLLVMKMSLNGVLNVVLGELAYAVCLRRISLPFVSRLPRMSAASLAQAFLVAVCIVPTTVYFYLYAPQVMDRAIAATGTSMQRTLGAAETVIDQWAETRMHEAAQFAIPETPSQAVDRGKLPRFLERDFAGIGIVDARGALVARWGEVNPDVGANLPRSAHAGSDLHLIGPAANGHLAISLPLLRSEEPRWVVADVKRESLSKVLAAAFPGMDLFLNGTTRYAAAIKLVSAPSTQEPDIRAAGLPAFALPRFVEENRTILQFSRPLAHNAEWELVAQTSRHDALLAARSVELRFLVPLGLAVIGLMLAGSVLANRAKAALREIGDAVAVAAATGSSKTARRLVVAELVDLTRRAASATSIAASEKTALFRTRRWLESLSRNAPVILYSLAVRNNRKADVLFVSETVHAILGYSPDEIHAADWWHQAIHPDDRERVLQSYTYVRPGEPHTSEYRLRHKDGHYVWVFDSMAVDQDTETGQLEAVGVAIDVSDRRHVAEQLVHAGKMSSLGRMAAGVAHELNQPLNFIKLASLNLTERVRSGTLDPEVAQEKLRLIIGQVERAATIITQIRTFGRRGSEAVVPVDLTTVVDNVVALIAPQFRADSISIEIERPTARQLMVSAQMVSLEQVLLNLLLNAADAIATRRSMEADGDEGRICIRLSKKKGKAIIAVTDNGTGIDPAIASMLFEPFFTTKGPQDGTGLGLSVSYGIVTDLGGTIHVEDAGEGARFVVSLPLTPLDTAATTPPEAGTD